MADRLTRTLTLLGRERGPLARRHGATARTS
jgi:hypothetical protein